MPKPLFSSLLVVLAATAACASPTDGAGEETQTASSSQPIISGKVSPSSQDAVVLIQHMENVNSGEACTGTMIAPNLVLTARHCVSVTGKEAFTCDKDGNLINDGNGGGAVGADYDPTDLYVFTGNTRPPSGNPAAADGRGRKIFHDEGKSVCGHDLAVLLLQDAIPSARVASIRLDSQATKGEKITAVGWGVTLDTKYPPQRQQRTGIPIVQVGPYSDKKVDVPGNDFLVGESTCAGDSGGPAFSEQTGAVIGVVSRGGNGKSAPASEAEACTDADNDYTQTAPFKSIIQNAFNEAGYAAAAESGRPADTSIEGGGCSIAAPKKDSHGAGVRIAGYLALAIFVVVCRRRVPQTRP